MSDFALQPLLIATWQTIYMVFIASFVSVLIGLFLGVVLFLSQNNRMAVSRPLNVILSFIVNVTRSVPFIILLISIIPFTRWIVGTSIGVNAAIVPLIVAAIPFYARVAETAIMEVSPGLLEAADAMGANRWQLTMKVLLPEALPSLVKGATLTIIGLIGYSAMAGAVGGGGLGELAINYGYQRFDPWVMLETVVLLVILVQLIQSYGDYLAKIRRLAGVVTICVVLWLLCVGSALPWMHMDGQAMRVGVMVGPQQEVMKVAAEVARKKYDLDIDVIGFNDYVQPNIALNDGSIQANIFQHVPYLDAQIKSRHLSLMPIAKTFIYPMGFYSKKISNISQLKNDAVVAMPNDPSNEGRALLLLQKYHLIKLKPGSGLLVNLHDVISNPKHLQFKLLDAAQLPRVFKDATLVGLTNDFLKSAGLKANQALIREGKDSAYANVIVVKKPEENKAEFDKLIKVMHSPEVVAATMEAYPDGEAIIAW